MRSLSLFTPSWQRARTACYARRLAACAALIGLSVLWAASPPVSPEHAKMMIQSRELFSKSVRQILTDNCLKCHGGAKTRGGLNLVTREAILKGGDNGVVLTPLMGSKSKLIRLVSHLDDPVMPPGENKKLTAKQIADLTKWIDLGAAYDKPLLDKVVEKPKTMIVTAEDRKFWSFQPLKRPTIPDVKDRSWAINPIDRFILAAQEKRGLSHSPPAERRVLIRRAFFNLIGLPPTPEEIEAFAADTSPTAYERLIDRLPVSPALGERWARHWLDLVRFAESHGFEHDYDRPNAYPYRDFVIKAFNDDLPFDSFIRMQLAGDEIEPNNPLALTATGFLGAGVHSTQITANTVEKERYDELDDIVRTMGTSMLGLTIGCARCHDHKYDPIPTKDYYQILSTFTKTVRTEVDIDLDSHQARVAREKHDALIKQRQDQLAQYEKTTLPAKLQVWLKDRKRTPLSAWSVVEPASHKSTGGAVFTRQPDGSLLVTGKNAPFDTYTFTLRTKEKGITALRLEALKHSSMVRGGPGRAGNGNFALSDVKITINPLKGGKSQSVTIRQARATFEQRGLPVSATVDKDPRSAWAVDPQFGKDHAAVFDFASPIGASEEIVLTVTLRFNNNTGHNIGRPRLSLSTQPSPPAVAGDGLPADVKPILAKLDEKAISTLSDGDKVALLKWYRGQDAGWRKMNDELHVLRTKGPATTKFKAMICSEGLPAVRLHSQGGDFLEQTHFLKRGDPNQKDGVANQSFLQVLMRSPDGAKAWQVSPPAGIRTPYLRRSLANWIVDVDKGAGHLLARVIVNRLWQYHFGRGIVATPSDFGSQGERPTHPELLDWLASELISSGWSLKHIHRLILTSATWRQASTFDEKNNAVDPENRFLWRMTPRRLEAEVIRDSILAVSDQLDRRMFGPGTLDRMQKRRAIYFFVKRSQLIPMMTLFDAPDGTVGIEQRTTTTIAPQALLLLNNKVVRQAADQFARRLTLEKDVAAMVRRGYSLAVGRTPTPQELAACVAFVQAQKASYATQKVADAEHRAVEDFCQVLLGLNEFIYID